jgi:hypothetical protein
MKKILPLALTGTLALGAITGCGTNRAQSILDACGPGARVVALDDDQVICESKSPDRRQFVRQAADDS